MFFATDSKLEGSACRDLPEDKKRLFFGKGYAEARAICRKCPVREECLEDALRFERPGEERFGVRGGMAADARTRKYG